VNYAQIFGYAKLEFVASCDYRGSDAYNMDLGKRRAAAVQHWLIENGLNVDTFSVVNNGDRFSPTRIMKGLFCPDCWEDRKVEITIE
jgi:outer membrane protein OmpA-like peptidoglycan-associated protein